MRGRTNVPQRKAPTINGTVQNMTVASGKSVLTGDFVQYKMQEQDSRVSSDDITLLVRNNFKISNDIFTQQEINVVNLVDVSDAYSVINYVNGVFHWKLSDGKILVLEDVYLKLYSITNNAFNLIQELNVGSENIGGVNTKYSTVCQLSNGKIILCTCGYNSGYRMYYKSCDYVNGVLSNLSSSSYISNSNFEQKAIGVIVGENNSFGLYIQIDTTYTPFYKVVRCVFENNAVAYKEYLYLTTNVQNRRRGLITLLNKNYVLMLGNNSTNAYEFYVGKVTSSGFEQIYDINVKSYVGASAENIAWSASMISDSEILVTYTIGGKTGSVTCYFFVVTIDEVGSQITTSNVVAKTITYTQLSGSYIAYDLLGVGTGFKNNNGKVFYLWYCHQQYNPLAQSQYSGKYITKFTFYDNVLAIGEETSYVEKWNGGRALGFAKTGGSNGDTVEIYVPQLSS